MSEFQIHYVPKKISEIDIANDSRVRITGTVVDVSENTMLIDDGSGTVSVVIDDAIELELETIKVNSLIRVFGVVLPIENKFEIRANVIQKLTGLDINLFKKVQDLYRKWGCELNV